MRPRLRQKTGGLIIITSMIVLGWYGAASAATGTGCAGKECRAETYPAPKVSLSLRFGKDRASRGLPFAIVGKWDCKCETDDRLDHGKRVHRPMLRVSLTNTDEQCDTVARVLKEIACWFINNQSPRGQSKDHETKGSTNADRR